MRLTGKLRWYYQVVHHDLFDYDLAAPPALIDVKRNGKTIPAVAQITKMGLLFILDRMTGKPVFGVEERPVPKSDVPGEESWPTQPFPLKPPPLARMSLTAAEITTRTPEAHKFCSRMVRPAAPSRAVHAVRHDALVDHAGHDGRRQLGRSFLRSRARLHLREHQQPGRHGPVWWRRRPARRCPIATRAATRASSIRISFPASSRRGAN